MQRNLAILLILMSAMTVSAWAATPILPAPTRVSEHLYAWIGPHGPASAENRGFRMNLAFVVGKNAVAVIETGYNEAMATEMLAHIARITSAPVKYAINSNSQPDRFLGNESFRRRGAAIVTTPAEAARMAEMGGMFAQGTESALKLPAGSLHAPGAPDRLIDAETVLDLGGVSLRLIPVAVAHTPGPLVVEVIEDHVVYGGDVLYSGRLLAVVDGGNVASWIQVFDGMSRFGAVTFVPGHGNPAKLDAFRFPTREYLVALRDHMKKMIDSGVDMQDAIDQLDQSRFAKLDNFEELARRNASFAYREAEAASFK